MAYLSLRNVALSTSSITVSSLTGSTITMVSSVTKTLNCSTITGSTIATTMTATTPAYGTNTTQLATTAYVQNAGFGNPNQTYKNYYSSGRVNGITYTNTTNAPIAVTIIGCDNPDQAFTLIIYIGGVLFSRPSGNFNAAVNYPVPFTFFVPVGSTYKVSWNVNANYQGWYELN